MTSVHTYALEAQVRIRMYGSTGWMNWMVCATLQAHHGASESNNSSASIVLDARRRWGLVVRRMLHGEDIWNSSRIVIATLAAGKLGSWDPRGQGAC